MFINERLMIGKTLKLFLLCKIFVLGLFYVLAACTSSETQEDVVIPTLGLVTGGQGGLQVIKGLKDGMADLGYIEGENIAYDFAGKPMKSNNLEAEVERLVQAQVNLIFVSGTQSGLAAHQVTAETDIPVVFGNLSHPVAAGVVKDLRRPGGKMTGVRRSQNQGRQLELFVRIIPEVKKVFVLYNPDSVSASNAFAQIQNLGPTLDIEFVIQEVSNEQDILTQLNNLPNDIDGIFLLPDNTVNAHFEELLAVAMERKIPIAGASITQVEAGALMAYSVFQYEIGVQTAHLVDQILKGTDPAELPVETAEFFLSINLKTSEVMGLEIPDDILEDAHYLIR